MHGNAAMEPLHSSGILPLVMTWVAMREAPVFRGAALCVLDDVLEHCVPSGMAVFDAFIPHLLEVRVW